MTEHVASNHYVFIWLDKTIETNKDNQDLKRQIQHRTRRHLRTFIEPDECVGQIMTEPESKRVILIVSNELGTMVLPIIAESNQVERIYVYCSHRQLAEKWTKPYPKVVHIFTDKHTLMRQIEEDVDMNKQDRQLPFSVFHLEEREHSLRSLTSGSANFMWYRAMISVLRSMANYCDSKRDMVEVCLASYHNDETEKRRIETFEKEYVSEKALHWYTRDSFVYRLLNRALRTQQSEIIFKFRFFVNELHDKIVQLYRQYLRALSSVGEQELTVYRGQHLSIKEVDSMRHSVNQLISMNSFLSATTDMAIAKAFASVGDQPGEASSTQSVLFIIKICNMTEQTTPFAFVQELSCCPGEEEVLFSIGAIFKVNSVVQCNSTWHVHLELSREQNSICQELATHMTRQIGTSSSPLLLGWYLYRMNEFNEAQRYAQFLLQKLPPNDKVAGDAYTLLGLIYKDSNLLTLCTQSYQKAIDIYGAYNPPLIFRLINTHVNLGLAYLASGDHSRASEQQKYAEAQLSSTQLQSNQAWVMLARNLKGKIQTMQGNYAFALQIFQPILSYKRKTLPPEHPSIATTLMDIGVVYERLGNHKEAMDYFEQALAIYKQSLPPDHLDRAECLLQMAHVNEKLQRPVLASQQYKQASNIKENSMRVIFSD